LRTVDTPVEVERLTADWLVSGRMKNLDFVESELRGFWGSLENPVSCVEDTEQLCVLFFQGGEFNALYI